MPDIFIGNTNETESVSKEKSKETTKTQLIKTASEEANKGIPALKGGAEHNHSHVLAAFCENPEGVSFTDKLEDEEIILFLRSHPITLVPWIIKAIILGLLPLILFAINTSGIININFLTPSYNILIILFYYFLIIGYIFVNYLTWFYNVSLVTTKRIVDIDFSQIVFENVDATKLTQVEDVGYVQIGVIRSIFDYGDVTLHTAGPTSNFEFLAVPHPERVVNIINNLLGEENNA